MTATATAADALDLDHHPDCHYGPLYCDGRLCRQAADAERRAIRAMARYEECPHCGLACDGDCEAPDDAEPQAQTSAAADRLEA